MSKTEVLDEVIADYLEAERLGHAPEQVTWMAHHPQLSGELRSFLVDRERFRQMAATLPGGSFASPAEATLADEDENQPRIVGNYEVIGKLGHGGMGIVYKARQVGLNRMVALKMVLDSAGVGGEALARFRAEAEAVARLKHPNIVQIYEVGVWEGRPFFSLEFVDGGTLAQRIGGQPQPARQAAALVETLAQAMDYAHQQGIVHRDLKPANVLLTAHGMPKVTDFGLAKHLEKTDGETRTGAILGTPSYIAPEQAAGKKDVGPLADVYALGTVLYELLTGRPPFKGETPMDTMLQVMTDEVVAPARLNRKVPRDLETICLRCLQKEPARRYRRAADLAADLRRFLNGESIQARPAGVVERGWRWCRRNQLPAVLVASVLFLFVSGVAAVTWQWRRAEANLNDARVERKRAEDNAADARRQRDLAESNAAAARKERDRAEKNFEQARKAVDESFTLISQNALLNTPGLQGLRKQLLDYALKYYQEFLLQHARNPALKREVAEAHHRLGVVLQVLGKSADAEAAFDKARQMYEDLVAARPDDNRARRGLAVNYLALARMQAELGRLDKATRSNEIAQDLLESLSREEPANLLYQDDLIFLYDSLAHLQIYTGHPDKALELFERGRNRLTKMVAVETTPHRRYRLGLFCKNIADHWLDRKQLDRARQPLEQALGLLKKLDEETPGNLNFQRDLGTLYLTQGIFVAQTGTANDALTWGEKARGILERLYKANPNVPRYQQDYSDALSFLGVARQQLKQYKEALPLFQESRRLIAELVTRYPDSPIYPQVLVKCWCALALCQRESGKPDEARQSYEQAVAVLNKRIREEPNNLSHREWLAKVNEELKKVAGP